MSRLRSTLEFAFRRLGFELIPNWRISAYASERVHADHLRAVFEQYGVDCVFDVGAFDGDFGRLIRNVVGFQGQVLSFEPQPEAFRQLEKASANDGRWKVFNSALGAIEDEVEMNVMAKPWFSSFLAPSPSTPENMRGRNAVEATVKVRMERLDDVFGGLADRYRFRRPFLKMDTQGFDLQVFRGAADCRDHFIGLQSEVSVIPIYLNMPNWKESLSEYQNNGFELSGMFPVSHDGALRAVEFDAVLVRQGVKLTD